MQPPLPFKKSHLHENENEPSEMNEKSIFWFMQIFVLYEKFIIFFYFIVNNFVHNFHVFLTDPIFLRVSWFLYPWFFFVRFLVFEIWWILYSTVVNSDLGSFSSIQKHARSRGAVPVRGVGCKAHHQFFLNSVKSWMHYKGKIQNNLISKTKNRPPKKNLWIQKFDSGFCASFEKPNFYFEVG